MSCLQFQVDYFLQWPPEETPRWQLLQVSLSRLRMCNISICHMYLYMRLYIKYTTYAYLEAYMYEENWINAPHANWRTINLKCAAGATGRNTFIYRYIKTETARDGMGEWGTSLLWRFPFLFANMIFAKLQSRGNGSVCGIWNSWARLLYLLLPWLRHLFSTSVSRYEKGKSWSNKWRNFHIPAISAETCTHSHVCVCVYVCAQPSSKIFINRGLRPGDQVQVATCANLLAKGWVLERRLPCYKGGSGSWLGKTMAAGTTPIA